MTASIQEHNVKNFIHEQKYKCMFYENIILYHSEKILKRGGLLNLYMYSHMIMVENLRAIASLGSEF